MRPRSQPVGQSQQALADAAPPPRRPLLHPAVNPKRQDISISHCPRRRAGQASTGPRGDPRPRPAKTAAPQSRRSVAPSRSRPLFAGATHRRAALVDSTNSARGVAVRDSGLQPSAPRTGIKSSTARPTKSTAGRAQDVEQRLAEPRSRWSAWSPPSDDDAPAPGDTADDPVSSPPSSRSRPPLCGCSTPPPAPRSRLGAR